MTLISQSATILLNTGLGTGFWLPVIVILFIGLLVFLYYRHLMGIRKVELQKLSDQLQECRDELIKLEELKKLLPDLKKIARLDHDVNTPLCVITMSLGRAKKLALETSDENLLTNVEDIVEAVGRIGEIMQAVRVLKASTLIAYKEK
ncbi:MAG: hypothetical protein PHC50_04220 [Candidatus Cloacimonetes bacterium]|nr:hypothetical protein [Candidatus Cloacimonadota bacterium]